MADQKAAPGTGKKGASTAASAASAVPKPKPKLTAKAAKPAVPSGPMGPRRYLTRKGLQGVKNLGAKAGALPQQSGNRLGGRIRQNSKRVAGAVRGGQKEGGGGEALSPVSGDVNVRGGAGAAVGVAGAAAGTAVTVAGRLAGSALRWTRRTVRLIGKIPYAKLVMLIVAIIVVLVVLIMSFVDVVDHSAAAEWAERDALWEEWNGGGPGSATVAAPVIAENTDIPLEFAVAYLAAAEEYDVPWTVLAAVGEVECTHGTYEGAGCNPELFYTSGPHLGSRQINRAGARGPMQFTGNTWRGTATQYTVDVAGPPIEDANDGNGYATDGDGDGLADPWNVMDAVHSAARLIEHRGDGDVWEGVHLYNPDAGEDKDNSWYVDEVRAMEAEYAAAVPDAELRAGDIDLEFTGPGYMGDAECPPSALVLPETGMTGMGSNVTNATQQMAAAVQECFGGPPNGGNCHRTGEDGGGHPRGRACDFMTCPYDPDNPCMSSGEGFEYGEQLVAWLIANHEALNVRYIIWFDELWHSRTGEWTDDNKCTPPQPGCYTVGHYDHVHVSIEYIEGEDPGWTAPPGN